MAELLFISLKDAIERLHEHGLRCRLTIQHDTLILIADLTRWDFNNGQPLPIFYIPAVDGDRRHHFGNVVIAETFERELGGYLARKAAGESLFVIHPNSQLQKEYA